MTDIKPDTSLYTDLPSRLRAAALVLEGPKGRLQYRCSAHLPWTDCRPEGWSGARRVNAVLLDGEWDYRLKPAPPARLYVDVREDGKAAYFWTEATPPMPGTTRVTYVLENPNEND